VEQDAPYMVLHTLCGEPIFYYFGDYEDAKVLKDFDNITTLDGEAIVPEDIRACKNCGVKISLSQLRVAEHSPGNCDTYEVKNEGDDISIDPKLVDLQQPSPEDRLGPIDNNFWVTPNDPNRIRKA
jgi:hypothetical protein